MFNFSSLISKVSNKFILVLIFIVGVLAARSLFTSGYFIMHDDLQMMRQLTMEKCFQDSQIPCRWSPDMGYGFGYPLFNYYPPLPYLVGEVFRVLGFAFTISVKLTFALSLILSAYSMYYLAREFFGRLGGLVSSVFYIWAPYRAVDVFVRGAMNESWTFVFMPLILLFSYRLISQKRGSLSRNVILLTVSYASLFLTHNLIVLIFTPFFLLWCSMFIVKEKKFSRIPKLLVSGIWSLGIAAFFTIPAFFEKNFVHFETLASDYYEFFAHYVSVRQLLISRFWGDGPSVFGIADEMAFPVGHIHWSLSLIVLVISCLVFLKLKKANRRLLFVFLSIFIGWFGAFMSHQRSSFVWFSLSSLKYVQFPWRFLTISALGMSMAAGVIIAFINDVSKTKKNIFVKITSKTVCIGVSFLLILLVILWNWAFFKPVRSGPVTDEERFSGEAWRIQQGAGIRDYLPLTADDDPDVQRKNLVDVMSGEVEVSGVKEGTYWALFDADTESEAVVRINTMYFPNWRVFIKEGSSSKEIPIFIPEEENWGRMWIKLPGGKHLVYLQLFNTPVRTVSNILSVLSIILMVSYPFWKKGIS